MLSRDLQIAGIPLGRERGSSLPFTTARSSPFQLIRIYCNPRHSLHLVYFLFVWGMVFTRKIYLGISLTQPNFLSPANFLHFLWYECKLFVQFVLIIMFQLPPTKNFVQVPLNKALSKENSEANIIAFWVWTGLMVLWDPPLLPKPPHYLAQPYIFWSSSKKCNHSLRVCVVSGNSTNLQNCECHIFLSYV